MLYLIFIVLMAVALYCYATFSPQLGYPIHIFLKMSCSTVFLIAGVLFIILFMRKHPRSVTSSTAFLLLTGLILGWTGDLLLDIAALKGNTFFIVGMLAFAMNHLIYLFAFFKVNQFKMINIPIILVIAVALSVIGVLVFNINIPKYLIPFGICYLLIITTALVQSASFLWSGNMGGELLPARIILFVGFLLFFISDAILTVYKFSNHTTTGIGIANGITYFYGQLIIAFAILKLPI